jgi:hypothetical protein
MCKRGCCYFVFEKKIVKHYAQCHILTQSLPGQCPSDNSILHTALDLCKNVSLSFSTKGNS